jgi:hypothetical protein
MATILSPNKQHNGISAGVRFTAGVGQTDRPAALAYFRKAGYGILPDGADVLESPTEPEKITGLRASLGAALEDGSFAVADSPFAPGPPAAIPAAPKPVRATQRRATRRTGRK